MRRTAEELIRLSRLLDQALDLPPQERATWIDGLDAANEEFKSSLRQMLIDTDGLGAAPLTGIGRSVGDAVLGAASAVESSNLAAGGKVGPYELIREIGRGGMGSVWLARREEGLTRRAVALKLPHPGLFNTELSQRVARERDILEGLAHPHIARLYEAGVTAAGQPYLALEFVEGVPINQYGDAQKLNMRERITLFQQVLDAMQYAHAHLVLHRDLKPANILVTGTGQAMLLDFGIAKLMSDVSAEDSPLTRIGGRALTPEYASPEQLAGQPLGTASDVYSLGVLLCEMLTGKRPHRIDQTANAKVENFEIVRPSTLAVDAASRRALKGDLDTILLKALKPLTHERYSSVAAMSEDLDRYLRGDTVLARPDTAWYRIKKFSERNRLAVGAVAAVVAALSVGLTVAMSQVRKARIQAARAEQIKSFALSMLESADSDSGAGVATTAVDLLQAARKRVESELVTQPAIAVELMTAVGYGLLGQDRSEDAADLLKRSVQLSLQTSGPDDVHTLEAQVVYGEALYDLGKNDEAVALLKQLPALSHRIGARHVEIDAWRNLANAYLDAGDADAAMAAARAAVAAVPELSASPERRDLIDAAQAHFSLANVLNNLRKPGLVDEARLALSYTKQLGGDHAAAMSLDGRFLLGAGMVREGQPAAGLRELKNAYADSRTLRGADHRQTLVMASILGTTCLEAGDIPGAVSAYQESFDATMRHEQAEGPFAVAWAHFGVAMGLAASHEEARAMPHFDEAVRLFSESGGADAPMTLRSRSERALTLARMGKLAESEREFMDLESGKWRAIDKIAYVTRFAMLRSLQQHHEEAIRLASSAVGAVRTLTSPAAQARSYAALGSVLLAAGRPHDALAPLQQSVSLFGRSQVPESPAWTEATANLARARQ
jgi:eukaryotic-like serine/threonine-protein kinase